MIKSYLKIAWRNLTINKAYTVINIVGLSLGIACGILLFSLVAYHLSFDTFHANKERIYRIVTEFKGESIEYQPGVPNPLGKAFRNDYAFAEKVARVKSNREALISIPGETEIKKFDEEENVALAEPAFFDIFFFWVINGSKQV